MKNIVIDAIPLLGKISKGTGVSKYISELLLNLFSLDKDNHYMLLFRTKYSSRYIKSVIEEYLSTANVSIKQTYILNRIIEFFWMKNNKKIPFFDPIPKDTDVFISTYYMTPPMGKYSIVSFVYDIIPLRVKEYSNISNEVAEKIYKTIMRSNYILTISEFSKTDILNYFGCYDKKIEVIYPGVGRIFNEPFKMNFESVISKYGIKDKFIFYAGVWGRHKNVLNLVRSFEIAKNWGIPHMLVLGGRKTAGDDDVYNKICEVIRNSKYKDDIIITDFIPEEDLPYFYQSCSVFCFLSLYEGFGMPVLEAMSCGAPVIVSNRSSLPEVIGDAGLLVDPENIEQIAVSILKVVSDKKLREEMSKKGKERARKFSWKDSAKKLMKVINELI